MMVTYQSPAPNYQLVCLLVYTDRICSNIAAYAFRAAANHLTELVSRDLRHEIVIRDAADLNAYERSHARPSKATKWLQRLSTNIHHYSNILDVLVQHHPEYVSLVWGAMKFLFVGVVNNEKTTAILAKSLAEIADHLPRWELKSRLYQTAPFLSRAYTWYQEPSFRRMIHSITQPPELRYDDILKEISDCSSNIHELAIAGSQAELRDMHKELQDVLHDPFVDNPTAFQAIHSSALINTNDRLSDLQLSQILSSVSQVPLEEPMKCYENGIFLKNMRASGTGVKTFTDKFWLSPKLERWSSTETSAMVAVKGSFVSQDILRDFCVDVVQQLRQSSVPVLWALRGAQAASTASLCSMQEILKYLTVQAIRFNHDSHTEKDMSWRCSQFQRGSTSEEWLSLLLKAIQTMKAEQLYLILDLETINMATQSYQGFNLISELERSFDHVSLKLKVLVVMYGSISSKCVTEEMADFVVPVRLTGRKKVTPRSLRRTLGGRIGGNRKGFKALGRSWRE
ncbi:hypothetical protein K456DRAFT_1748785 [Colletotrichum gloeosporioides 23]|nr:hypothetical protein K456DRAFT_1748785 [Colletotrichum gloeosporioides 23]